MSQVSRKLPLSYRGRRTTAGTIVEAQTPAGTWRPLNPQFKLRNHSPTGFEWGYGGSGPAQLALALAASRLPAATAVTIYQRLKRILVARFDRQQWHLEAERLDELLSSRIAADLIRCEQLPGEPASLA
jgi:hypothetical protein